MPHHSCRQTDDGRWAVGYESRGQWHLHGTHATEEIARSWVAWLNGSTIPPIGTAD